jgi:hypothetical protein
MVGGCVIASKPRLPSAGSVVVLNRRAWERSSASSVLAPPVSVPPKLGVTTAETEHMPIYLRTFLRVLSSWVHQPYGAVLTALVDTFGLRNGSVLLLLAEPLSNASGAHKDVATSIDRHELRTRDVRCGGSGERVQSEGVVPSMDDERRDRQLLEWEPVRCEARDEPVEDRAPAPRLVRKEQLS